MYPKYRCFGCGNIWHSGEIMAVCPICRGKGVKVKEGVKAEDLNIPEKEAWNKIIAKCEKFVERNKRT